MAELHTGARALGDSVPDVRGVLREAVSPLAGCPGYPTRRAALHDLTPVASDLRHWRPGVAAVGDTSRWGCLEPTRRDLRVLTNMTSACPAATRQGHWLRVVPLVRLQSVEDRSRCPPTCPHAYPPRAGRTRRPAQPTARSR